MKSIDPNAIYEAEELAALLRGHVKVETLREHGLVGLPGSGYFGGNVVDAIRNYCSSHGRQRGARADARKDSGNDSFIENGNAGDRRLDHRTAGRKVQDQGAKRDDAIHAVPGGQHPLETQRDKLRRLASS